eukprot:361792-Prorocentrum_minimum.AAC.2
MDGTIEKGVSGRFWQSVVALDPDFDARSSHRLTFSKRKQILTLHIPLSQTSVASLDRPPQPPHPADTSSHPADCPSADPPAVPKTLPVDTETLLGELPSLDWANSRRPAVVAKPLMDWDGYRRHRGLALQSKAPLGL